MARLFSTPMGNDSKRCAQTGRLCLVHGDVVAKAAPEASSPFSRPFIDLNVDKNNALDAHNILLTLQRDMTGCVAHI